MYENQKREKEKRKGKRREKKGEGKNRREREKKTKREFCFSLRSMEIKPSIFAEAKGKVGPRNESYAWVPKSRSLVKFQEVENFPTWVIYILKVIE